MENILKEKDTSTDLTKTLLDDLITITRIHLALAYHLNAFNEQTVDMKEKDDILQWIVMLSTANINMAKNLETLVDKLSNHTLNNCGKKELLC